MTLSHNELTETNIKLRLRYRLRRRKLLVDFWEGITCIILLVLLLSHMHGLD